LRTLTAARLGGLSIPSQSGAQLLDGHGTVRPSTDADVMASVRAPVMVLTSAALNEALAKLPVRPLGLLNTFCRKTGKHGQDHILQVL